VKLPAAVEFVVERVNVEAPAPLMDDGLKLAMTPLGRPLALSDIVPLNPLSSADEIV